MTPPTVATPSEIAELSRCTAVFLPADPARTGRVAFWRPDGPEPTGPGTTEEITVVVPALAAENDRDDENDGDGGDDGNSGDDGGPGVRIRAVRALVLPLAEALPVLTRARARAAHAPSSQADPTAAFWGAAAVLALQLAARGRLLPG
ncbi:ATP-dependent helicase, partial [Streptomyces sp. 2MCAF27]